MSYNGILPDFSICSGVEVLLYLPRSLPWPLAAPAADCPGRLPHQPAQKPPDPAATGPPQPLPGSSAAASWEELRPPASDAAPVPFGATAGGGLGEEGEEKKAGEEKTRVPGRGNEVKRK